MKSKSFKLAGNNFVIARTEGLQPIGDSSKIRASARVLLLSPMGWSTWCVINYYAGTYPVLLQIVLLLPCSRIGLEVQGWYLSVIQYGRKVTSVPFRVVAFLERWNERGIRQRICINISSVDVSGLLVFTCLVMMKMQMQQDIHYFRLLSKPLTKSISFITLKLICVCA